MNNKFDQLRIDILNATLELEAAAKKVDNLYNQLPKSAARPKIIIKFNGESLKAVINRLQIGVNNASK